MSNSTTVATHKVTVNPAPAVGLAMAQQYCAGTPVDFAASVAEGTSALWQFGDGTQASGTAVRHAYAAPGLYPVTLALDDGRGLSNSTRIEEAYARVNAVPVAVAGASRTRCFKMPTLA